MDRRRLAQCVIMTCMQAVLAVRGATGTAMAGPEKSPEAHYMIILDVGLAALSHWQLRFCGCSSKCALLVARPPPRYRGLPA